MIVLHPSSRCDVCLEPYSWSSAEETPHAIPCGHVFCKTCLRTVAPPLCPLCRKVFQPDRLKKLHVDRPPESSGSEQQLDFLQRLALVSGEHAPPENVAEVVVELQTWLAAQPSDAERPIRCALDALRRHQNLKDRYDRGKAELKELRRQLRRLENNAKHDSTTAEAVEQSLLSRLQEVEEDYSARIATAESEVASLRSEVARFRHSTNPLPPPPEPIPLNRFPPFANAVWQSSTAMGPAYPYAKKGDRDQSRPHNSVQYANGYVSYDADNNNTTATATAPVTPFMMSNVTGVAAEREAKTGHTSERELLQSSRLGSQTTQVFPPAHEPVHSIYPYSRSQNKSEYRHRNGIIPGAPPAHRIIPGTRKSHDGVSGTRTSSSGSLDGWGEAIGSIQNAERVESLNDTTANSNARQGGAVDGTFGVPSHLAPAAAYVSGFASGYGNGYMYAQGHQPAPSSASFPRPRPAEPEEDTEDIRSLSLLNAPVPTQPGSAASRLSNTASLERPSTFHRHRSPNVSDDDSDDDDIYDAPRPVPPLNVRRRSQGPIRPGTVGSRSSWGTVNTAEALRSSMNGRGSMSELGLVGLQGVVRAGGPNANAPEPLLTTPVRLGHENGFMGAEPIPFRENDEDEEDNTPSHHGHHVQPMSRHEAAEHRRSRHEHRSSRTHRSDRHHRPRRSSTYASDPRPDGERTQSSREPPTSAPALETSENALALTFTAPVPVNDRYNTTTPSHNHPPITAPTPIVSTQNVLRSWALDFS